VKVRRTAILLGPLALCLAAGRALAAPGAYVDEVAIHGRVAPGEATAFVHRVLGAAGLEPRRAAGADDPAATTPAPCGRDPACLAERGRREGARVAVRATVLELAGEVSISLYVVDTRTGAASEHARQGVDLRGADEALTADLRSRFVADRGSSSRTAAWTLAASAIALGAGGAFALLHAEGIEDAFFADHVNANGDVVGISPADAMAEEDRARAWTVGGGVLLGGAAVCAGLSIWLFSGSF
jgi:hypothetical protein